MKTKHILVILLNLSLSAMLTAQNWQNVETVEDVCTVFPKQMLSMLSQYNLDYPGLEKVKKAYNNNDIEKACTFLLEYYKNGNTAEFLRKEQPVRTSKTESLADTILTNVFVVQNVRGKVPWGDDGHRDWYYKGPNNDKEWAWLSNRHSQINHVSTVYFETGNQKYLEYIDLFLRDFIIKSMPYPAKRSGTSVWRGLEVAARIKVWSRIFYGALNNPHFSDATRLLMLFSLPEHAHYNRNFHAQNNWLTMEISALATVATNFPEYKNADEWLDYSIATMTESMKGQVYPDGAQTELTVHYHNVALKNFELLKDICDRANKPMPEYFNNTLENMYNYTTHMVRPDGNCALNNDGDRGSDRDFIISGAKKYNRPDWEYIASNGKTGTKPADGPSYFSPWAGHLISRSSFSGDAHWSLFDVGPWGSGHQHNDKLHISISAYGRDLLVDAGRFAYTGDVATKFRPYAKGTQGHNAILIDGKGQASGSKLAHEAIAETDFKISPDFDFACNSINTFNDLEDVNHSRSLFYVRGEFWIVVDKVKTKQARIVETLWHWHPNCQVINEGDGVVASKNERGNLRIIPVGKSDWELKMIKGQEQPEIQGWYSPEYNKFEPNVACIYSSQIKSDATFVWLLVPSETEMPQMKAKVLSESIDEIIVEVTQKEKGSWKIIIPFYNSKNANLQFEDK